jgi:predicted metal-binding protein
MNHSIDPAILSAIRTLRTCERSHAAIASRPTGWPYRVGTIAKATKARKLAKVAKDMAMALETLVPAFAS